MDTTNNAAWSCLSEHHDPTALESYLNFYKGKPKYRYNAFSYVYVCSTTYHVINDTTRSLYCEKHSK